MNQKHLAALALRSRSVKKLPLKTRGGSRAKDAHRDDIKAAGKNKASEQRQGGNGKH